MSTKQDEYAVALDYETFYDSKKGYSLTTMSPQLYCAHELFDPYLVAICGKDIFKVPTDYLTTCDVPEGIYRTLEDGRELYIGRPENFRYWENLNGRILIAHNAAFDKVVTDECIKRKLIPELKDVEWQCTADLTAFLGVQRNLKAAMKYLFGKEISKAVRAGMDGRHDYELNKQEHEDLYEYGGADAVECHDLWLKYSNEWPEIERKISTQNRTAMEDGVYVDAEYAEASLKELRSYSAKVACDIPWVTQINPKTKDFYKVGSLPALRQAVIDLGIDPPKSFKKDDPGFLTWLETHDNIPFIKARQKAVAIAMHSARIEGILSSLDSNKKAHPGFLYFGAHTGRFSGKSASGGANINMLNMPRKPVLEGDENVFGGKGVDIRGMYIPAPGHKFVVFDYAQVEARFSLWLVDDTHMMHALEREGNLYQANAVMMKWCKSGESIKKNKPDLYRLAKCCLTADTLILIRTEKSNGQLTKPYYKRIIQVTIKDWVWDGHEWVKHLGVEKMKEVKPNELIETGGVCLTKDHRVYINDTESRRADEVFGDTEAAAISWGQANNPVRGWSHVRILASALVRVSARALGLCAREALHLLAGALRLHRVRNGGSASVGQCSQGSDDAMHEVRSQSLTTEGCTEHVGEGA